MGLVRRVLVVVSLAAPLMLLISGGSAAGSPSFLVDTTVDAVDASPGDGVCTTAAGTCALRAAVQEANALPGADRITLPPGNYVLAIGGTREDNAATGDLDITDNVKIAGAGPAGTVVDGGFIDRVFHVLSRRTWISGLTVRHGGGSFFEAGGILNESTLSIDGSLITGNTADVGGGIINSGFLTMTDSVISGNGGTFGTSLAGGLFNQGTGTAKLSRVSIVNNHSGAGGGVLNAGAAVLKEVTIADNSASSFAGGIWNAAASARLTLTDATVSHNYVVRNAGGIANHGDATLVNVTISGNVASGDGAGMWNSGSANLINVTVAGNQPRSPPSGGVGFTNYGLATVANTLIANHSGPNCEGLVGITSAGHNLDDDGTCGFSTKGDLVVADALLGPLANNGGPTLTHALLAGSPAIDGGANHGCPDVDQRGVPRPLDGDADRRKVCDIGAYEVQPP